MSSPGYRITDFFNKASSVSSSSDLSVFMQQYWYVWLILAMILVIMVIINVLMIIYFRRRNRPYKKPDRNFVDNLEPESKTVMIPQSVNKNGFGIGAEAQQSNAQFAMEALITNNKYRALHSVPALKYNENLSKIAQSWAETLGKQQKLQRSPAHWRKYNNINLGENLAYLFNSQLTGEKMIDMWYGESAKHDYTMDKQPETSQFTQMIWRDSKEVGFGRVRGNNGEWWYGVAMYLPSGNIVGHYAENVPPPGI